MTCVVNGQTQGRCPSYTFGSTTNQITNSNYTYDSSGDLTQNGTGTGTHTFQWDAENRMKSVGGSTCSTATACYTYNALGQRAERQTGTTYLEYLYDPSTIEVEANPRQTYFNWHYLFLGGRRFGKYANNSTYFIHTDNGGAGVNMFGKNAINVYNSFRP